MADRAQKSGKAAGAKKAAPLEVDQGRGWETAGRILAGFIVLLTVAAGAFQLYEALFPAWPTRLPLAPESLQAVLGDGAPVLILCKNSSTIDTAGKTAAAAAAELGIASYVADCDHVLPSGATLYDKLGFTRWNPAWGILANGKKGVQLAPSLLYKSRDLAEKIAPHIKEPKYTRIDGDRDLDVCLRERSGGCLLVYSSMEREALVEDLTSIAASVRNTTIAALHSAKLHFKSTAEGLAEAVKSAVASARSVSSSTAKAAVLIHARRVAPSLAAGDTQRVLVTVSATEGAGVSMGDVRRLLATSTRAYALLKAPSAGPTGGEEGGLEGSIEGMLARDEELRLQGSAIVSRSELSIARPTVKQPPASSTPHKQEEEGTPTGGERKERGGPGSAGSGEEGGPPLSPQQQAELARRREREVREAMAREEAESAHFASAAEGGEEAPGGEEEEGAGRAAGQGAGQEDVESEDLDDANGEEEEL